VRGRHVWEEQQTSDRPSGTSEPVTNSDAAHRERGSVRSRQCVDPATRRRGVADDQQARDPSTRPPARPCDVGSESCLSIDTGKCGLRIGDDRLDLCDEDDARRLVISEHVDRAALAADRERHLDIGLPTIGAKPPDKLLDEVRVRLVEQAIESLAVPAEADVQGRVERLGDLPERPERD